MPGRFSRTVPRCSGAMLLLLVGAACAAQSADLSGRVVDDNALPVSAASVSLHCAEDARKDAHTTSKQDGTFEFPSLAACNYTVSAAAEGFSALPAAPLTIASAGHLSHTVVLSRMPAARAAERPSFQAAGIHGLIDPGGYSASATAGAAADVLHDVSGVQRTMSTTPANGDAEDCATLAQHLDAARLHPSDWRASAAAGRSLLQNGQAGAAVPYLRQADALAPASAVEVRLDLADALIRSGSFRAALTRLASLSPQQAGLRYYPLRARAEEGTGDFDAAIHDRDEAVKQAATPENLFALAYEHLLAGHVQEAGRALQDGLARYPQSVALHVGLGAVQFFQHSFGSAQQALLEAARIDPRDRRPYPLLADISRMPDLDTAGVQQALERHLAIDPDDASGNAALGSLLLRRKAAQPDRAAAAHDLSNSETEQRAEQLLQRALALDPGLTQARSDLALLYHREQKFRQEADELARVAAERPSRDVQYRLGLAYRDSGQTELAKLALQRVREAPGALQESPAQLASLLSVSPTPNATLPCPRNVRPKDEGSAPAP